MFAAQKPHRLIATALTAGALSILSACSGDDDTSTPKREGVITQIPATYDEAQDNRIFFGFLYAGAQDELRSMNEYTMLFGDERYFDVMLPSSDQNPYLFKDERSRLLNCGSSVHIEVAQLLVNRPELLKVTREADQFRLSPQGEGQVSVSGVGQAYLLQRGEPSEADLETCQAIFGEDLNATVTWRSQIKLDIVRPSGVQLWLSPWRPDYGDAYTLPGGCSPGPQGELYLVEGQSAVLGYSLLDAYAKPLMAKNWPWAEPFNLFQPDELPRLSIDENQHGRLSIKSVEGVGAAFLETAWGQHTRIEVVERSQIEDVELRFVSDYPSRLLNEQTLIPVEEYNRTLINQGPVTLKNGSRACADLLPAKVELFSPEVCTVTPHQPRPKDPPRSVEHDIRFLKPGQCEFELSWPGTSVRKRYTLNGVEAK